MKLLYGVLKFILLVLSSAWVGLLIWTHQPFGYFASVVLVTFWGLLTLLFLTSLVKPTILPQSLSTRRLGLSFALGFVGALIAFFSLTPSNTRDWKPEVARLLDYTLADDGKTLTLYNVRNFDWQTESTYQPHWETRQYNLDKLQSVDLVASYWMGPAIAHTLVSFGFSDGQHLALSIEIRKENNEEFSTLGGFFRQYELIIIAADEKDVIYTRSNVRLEDVYIYPVSYNKAHIRALLLAYLNQARSLKTKPVWYNSLLNNCTTAIYYLVKPITPAPLDYRLVASGYIPEYLYNHQAIDNRYPLAVWQQKAHINPKTTGYDAAHPIASSDYSALIRSDWIRRDF